MSLVERENQALQLRKAGASYAQIATQLGYANLSGAWKACMRAIKRVPAENAREARDLDLARLDEALLAVWRDVQQGRWRAIETAIHIMERRAKLLGLDAPTRVRIDAEVAIREVAAGLGLDPEEVLREAQAVLDSPRRG